MLILIFITILYHTFGVSAVSIILLFNIKISQSLNMFAIDVELMGDTTLIMIA